jgi:iron(III) transport system substrate-binding protein
MLVRLLAFAAASAACAALAPTVPAGYPADYAQTIAAAKKEGKVVIYSALDTKAAQPLIKDFQALYPGIKVEYNDMNSTEMYNRFIAEAASGQGSADIMWSSAMDLQVKLVDDGQALTYASPEAGKPARLGRLQEPGVWDDVRARGVHLQQAARHGTRCRRIMRAFAKLINTKVDKFRGKVTTYDIEKSGVGFMFVVQDAGLRRVQGPRASFGATNYRVYASTGSMLEKVSSGEHLLGYNVLGSYALVRARDPALGVVLPGLHARVRA